MDAFVFERLLSIGGVEAISTINKRKAHLLYSPINKYNKTYLADLAENYKYRTNVPLRVIDANVQALEELEAQLFKGPISSHIV